MLVLCRVEELPTQVPNIYDEPMAIHLMGA